MKAFKRLIQRLELPPNPPPTGLSEFVLRKNPFSGRQNFKWARTSSKAGSGSESASRKSRYSFRIPRSTDSSSIFEPFSSRSSTDVKISIATLIVTGFSRKRYSGQKSSVPPAKSTRVGDFTWISNIPASFPFPDSSLTTIR